MRKLVKTSNKMQIATPNDIQREFARLLERPFAQHSYVPGLPNVPSKLRVTEDEKFITVKADVLGFEARDVHVRVEQGFLLIYGKKGFRHKSERKDLYSYELTQREFSHCLPLPKTADAINLMSGVKNGILEILIPKKS